MANLTPQQQQKLITLFLTLKKSDTPLHNFIVHIIKNKKTGTVKYTQGDENTIRATKIDGTSVTIGQLVNVLTRHTSD